MGKTFVLGRWSCGVKAVLISAVLLALIVIEYLNSGSYLDDIIGLVALIYLLVHCIRSQLVSKREFFPVACLYFIIIWGCLSNLISDVDRTWFSIIVDAVSETKVMGCFFLMRYTVDEDTRRDLTKLWGGIARLFIIVAFFFSLLTQIVDTGMYAQERYGLRSFNFIFYHAFQFTCVELSALLIVIFDCQTRNRPHLSLYMAAALITLALTTKAPALIFSAITICLLIYFKRNKRISLKILIPIFILILVIGTYQIQNYLLKPDTPRNMFTVYSVVTANDYFPFGSGFATFGSDQASKDYSPLYYRYGFNKLWGLGIGGGFLSDNFWQCALGQFGWFGFIVYLIPWMYVFRCIGQKAYSKEMKSVLYAIIIQFYVHGLGSAVLSSAAGTITFMTMGIIMNYDKWGDRDFGYEVGITEADEEDHEQFETLDKTELS